MAKLDKIKAHGCNVFVNRQLIYNVPEQYFADMVLANPCAWELRLGSRQRRVAARRSR